MEDMLRLTIGMLLVKLGGKATITKGDLEKFVGSGERPMLQSGSDDHGSDTIWYLERPGEPH